MATNYESGNTLLRLWFLMHRDVGLLRRCEDQMYGEKGLTTEQFSVLVAIKYLRESVRISDVAWWIGRTPNSASMIIDRMVKAGLVRRVRDRKDRRTVFVTMTSKAENALKLAIPAGWEFIQKIMSPLSEANRHTFERLLETLRYEALNYLNPGEDIEVKVVKDDKSHLNMMERLFRDSVRSSVQAKR